MPFNEAVISFFENISKYYESKTEISAGITTSIDNVSAKDSTWNLLEFILIRSAYRTEGNKFMLEGKKVYYEISESNFISFEKKERNNFKLKEHYSKKVFRIIKIRFNYIQAN